MVRRVRADRERQSMAIHNRHDFHAFSALRSSDFQPATLGHNEGCVDEAFFFVQYASIAKLVGNAGQAATRTVPLVGMSEDMVAEGLVTSLARPGGPVTLVRLSRPAKRNALDDVYAMPSL